MDSATREEMIEEMIRSCGGCGSREFPRRWDCVECIAEVDRQIADAEISEADRIAAITRDIASAA